METLSENPNEETEQETAFDTVKTASGEYEPLNRKISSRTSRANGSSSPLPDGRKRSTITGSIFVAEEPYADCLSGYDPEEPEDNDDVFETK